MCSNNILLIKAALLHQIKQILAGVVAIVLGRKVATYGLELRLHTVMVRSNIQTLIVIVVGRLRPMAFLNLVKE
jgi:hypothetical protein